MDKDFHSTSTDEEQDTKPTFNSSDVKEELQNQEFTTMEYKIESSELELDEAEGSIKDPNELTHVFVCPVCQKKFGSLNDTKQHLLKVSIDIQLGLTHNKPLVNKPYANRIILWEQNLSQEFC